MRPYVRWLVAIILAFAGIVIPVPNGWGSHGDGPKFTAWDRNKGQSISYDKTGDYCLINTQIGMQEFGKHGVQGFKWRMRAYDQERYVAQEVLAGIIHTWGWYYTSTFPNDTLTYTSEASLPGAWMRVAPTESGLKPSAVIRLKAVAIRPSWWQRDLKVWLTLGNCSYEDGVNFSI